jgi:gliding motility-associated-like protein
MVLLMVFMGQAVLAQNGTVLPTRGKVFWTGYMQNGFGAQSLKVHVMGTTATSGTVSIPGSGWTSPFTVAANGVAVVEVPTSAENNGSETVQSKGVLIQAQDSVNVFISSFQNFTHDLSQILPISSLGSSYRVDSYQGLPNFNNLHKSELLIVATEDGTQVRITPTVNTLGGRPAGVPFTVDLNEGQSYQVQAVADNLDLTGTLVEATANSGSCRPFVVLGGSMCATVPGSCSACDAIFEQLIPRSAWGTRYFTVPIQGVSSTTYRIMADENGTTVTIGAGAPIMLNAGQRHEVNGNTTPVCIQANKPVSVVQLLEGYSCAGNGDPSMVLLAPADRMSTKALLHTPTSAQLNQHSISVVVPTATVGQLTLNGTVVNPALFQPYAGCGDRMHARFPVTAGVHRLQAAGGFQAYMFGLGYGESYGAGVQDIKAVSIPQDSIVCGAGTVTLNAPEPLTNITWTAESDPSVVLGTASSLTISPSGSDSYTVTGSAASSGCPRSFTYHVGVPLTIPTTPNANNGPSATICQFETVQLGLDPQPDPGWFQIQWSPANTLNDPTIGDPIATPQEDTWYTVSITSPTGCGAMVDSILVEVAPAQVLELNAFTQRSEVCLGDSTLLTSRTLLSIGQDRFESSGNVLWDAIQGGTISNVCGSFAGNALYFNGNGQRSAQTVGLNTQGGGRVRFHLKIADGTAPCQNADPGEDVVLEYTTNNGFSWSLITTFQEDAYPVFTAIDQAIPVGAQGSNTMFRLRQSSNSGAGQDNWAVDDFLVARYDNNWLSYSWSPNTVTNASAPATTAYPTVSGWYVLSGTDPTAGCVYQDSVYVHVDPAFNLTVTNDTTLCSVAGLVLHAVPSFNTSIQYQWGPNDGSLSDTDAASPIATPEETTTYTVQATTASGCAASGAVTIQVGQLLDLTLTAANDTLCQGQSTLLTATALGGTDLVYAWTGAGLNNYTISAPTATPAQTTTYVVTVTHTPTGCALSASITIVVNTGYTINAGPDLSLCSALGHTLNVQHNIPGASYAWSPAGNLNTSNIQAPSITADVSATYTVTVTDANGCSLSDQVEVTRAFDGLPSTGSASSCINVPVTLSAPLPGVSYLWNTGAVSPSIVPTASGPYTVTITNAQGCQGVTTFNVTLFPLPVLELGPDVALCGASSHTIQAGSPGNSVTWSTGATGQQLIVTSSGTYTATVTTPNGCVASDLVEVVFNALPSDELQDQVACVSAPPTLNAGNAGCTYLWNTGAATQSITAIVGGTYSVLVTTPANCSATFDAMVTLAPEIALELGNDTSVCEGTSLVIDAGTGPGTVLWSTGSTSSSITVEDAGTYSVTMSNGSCSASDAITVAVIAAPVDALLDVTICSDDPVLLDAANPGCTYLWNTGATTRTLEPLSSGTYSVVVTNANGCSRSSEAVVVYVMPPVVALGSDSVLCEGEQLVLDAGNPGSTYLWNTGSTARRLTVRESGQYSVTVTNSHCQRSDAIDVLFNPSPARMATRQYFTCLEEAPGSVLLDAGNPGSEFLWSTGDSVQTITAEGYGWFAVDIRNAYDCSIRDSVLVSEYCPSAIYLPNTFTPNGDGLNDVFIPVGKNIATMQLLIFDRWGAVLFESNDPTIGWDGTYRNEVVKNDVYMWRLVYRFQEDVAGDLGMEQELMGHIQVLR